MVYKSEIVIDYIANVPRLFIGKNGGEIHLFRDYIALCGKVAKGRIYMYRNRFLRIHRYVESCCLHCLIKLAILLKHKIEGNKVWL